MPWLGTSTRRQLHQRATGWRPRRRSRLLPARGAPPLHVTGGPPHRHDEDRQAGEAGQREHWTLDGAHPVATGDGPGEGDAEDGGAHARPPRRRAPPRGGARAVHGWGASVVPCPLAGQADGADAQAADHREPKGAVGAEQPGGASTTTALTRNVAAKRVSMGPPSSEPKSRNPVHLDGEVHDDETEGPPPPVHEAEGDESETRGEAARGSG